MRPRQGPVAVAGCLGAALLLVGCATAAGMGSAVAAGAPAGASGPSGLPSGAPTPGALTSPSSGPPAGGLPSGPGAAGSPTPDGGTLPPPPPLQTEPGPMVAPTVVGAVALGCTRLSTGGVSAQFRVTFDGGQNWAVVARFGPVARGQDGTWSVTKLDQDGARSVRLPWVLVGGGAPYGTATVVVPDPPTATCPSP